MNAYLDMDDSCPWWDETRFQDDRSPRDDHVGASCQILTLGSPIQSAPSTYPIGHMLSHVWAPLAAQMGPSLLVKNPGWISLYTLRYLYCAQCTPHIYVYGHGIMFLQPIGVIEIHHWVFRSGDALGWVHYGELIYLICSVVALSNVLILHNAIMMHYPLCLNL